MKCAQCKMLEAKLEEARGANTSLAAALDNLHATIQSHNDAVQELRELKMALYKYDARFGGTALIYRGMRLG